MTEVFRLNHRAKAESLMKSLAGRAAIGHVRYATCGQDDRSYAQPFERKHIHKRKWFSFCFNGQLSNYGILKERLLADGDHHLSLDTDTEIILHEFARVLSQTLVANRLDRHSPPNECRVSTARIVWHC